MLRSTTAASSSSAVCGCSDATEGGTAGRPTTRGPRALHPPIPIGAENCPCLPRAVVDFLSTWKRNRPWCYSGAIHAISRCYSPAMLALFLRYSCVILALFLRCSCVILALFLRYSCVEVKHSKRSSLCRSCFIVSTASVLLGVLSFFRAVNFCVHLCVLASSECSRMGGPGPRSSDRVFRACDDKRHRFSEWFSHDWKNSFSWPSKRLLRAFTF